MCDYLQGALVNAYNTRERQAVFQHRLEVSLQLRRGQTPQQLYALASELGQLLDDDEHVSQVLLSCSRIATYLVTRFFLT